ARSGQPGHRQLCCADGCIRVVAAAGARCGRRGAQAGKEQGVVDFELTEEQRAIQGLAREFAQKEMAPVALEYDPTAEFPWPVARKAFDVGLMNLTLPSEYGGGGLDHFDSCLVGEELAAGCAGMNVALSINTLGCGPVLVAGTDEQKREWLSQVTSECNFVS